MDFRTERLAIACGDRSDKALHPSQVAAGNPATFLKKEKTSELGRSIIGSPSPNGDRRRLRTCTHREIASFYFFTQVGREHPSAWPEGRDTNWRSGRRLLFVASATTAVFEAAEFAGVSERALVGWPVGLSAAGGSRSTFSLHVTHRCSRLNSPSDDLGEALANLLPPRWSFSQSRPLLNNG